jgi:phosphoglycolate phosphatase-like HAD superfamily hydrolase
VVDVLKLVIMDIDDTLVRTPIDWLKLRKNIESITGVYIDYKPLIRGVFMYLDRELRELALREIEKAELESAVAVNPSIPLRELVSNLKKCGCRVSVVTLRGRDSAVLTLRSLGIYDLVDLLVTRDDSMDRVEQLSLVLTKLGVSSREAVFMGDSPDDLEALLKLHLSTILIRQPSNLGVPEVTLRVLSQLAYACCM